jgi:ribosomal protection tetracycline resistance protein
VFINKIDRMGARPEPVLRDLERRVQLRLAPLNQARGAGEPGASVHGIDWADPAWRADLIDRLAEVDDTVIDAFDQSGGDLPDTFLTETLRRQIALGGVTPVFHGSARTGAGVPELLDGIERWLTPPERCDDAPPSARIFKITRGKSGEKLAYARLDAGTLAPRQRISLCRALDRGEGVESEERLTAVDRFEGSVPVQTERAVAGEIAVLHGARSARIGDWIGENHPDETGEPVFGAPPFESLVRAADPAQANALHAALDQLAEQDPLISLRVTDDGLSVSLFGDVQKEVLTDLLDQEYGIKAWFGQSRIVCIERVLGSGDAVEIIGSPENPFAAGMGFRVEAGPVGSGVRYERELGSLPPAFYRAIEETVFEWTPQGLHGWAVTDCVITLHSLAYWSPVTVAGDFRKLAPLPLFAALRRADTTVCEPVDRLEIELPVDDAGAVIGVLTGARATLGQLDGEGDRRQLSCIIPTAELREVERQLPRLTHGEGSWIAARAGYQPVDGILPERKRIGPNPLIRDFYLGEVARM